MVCDVKCDRLFVASRRLCWHGLYRCECRRIYNGYTQCDQGDVDWHGNLDELTTTTSEEDEGDVDALTVRD